MITHEPNYQRKAHRIDIPLFVLIDNETYEIKDWSTTGLQIKDKDNKLKTTIKEDDEVFAKLILPTGNSSIILNLYITLRNAKYLGFEITNIDDKNRRVLRHYATLAIEGNAHRLEDLAGSLNMTNVETPIKEPISLSEEEYTKVEVS